MGRTELFRAQGGDYRKMEEGGHFFVVVEMNVKYRTPARFDDLLSLKTKVVRVTPAKLEHEYRLFRDGDRDRRRHEAFWPASTGQGRVRRRFPT